MKTEAWLFATITILAISYTGAAQNPSSIPKNEKTKLDIVETPIELTTLEPFEDFTRFVAKDDQGLCAVHHQPLKKLIVPVHYGHIIDFKELDREEFFPNATDWARGGCVVYPDSKYQALILQCTECLEVREKRWAELVKRIKDKNRDSKK